MINNIYELMKNINSNEANIKNELINLIEKPELKPHALALNALMFNETTNIKDIEMKGGNPYLLILNGTIVNQEFQEQKANLLIYQDKILATSLSLPESLPENADSINIIDATEMIITPGLIDQHIHGGFGCDFNRADQEKIVEFSQKLPEFGVTSFLATIMTDKKDIIKKQIAKIKSVKANLCEYSSKILGIHLEGPCLSPSYKGIHPDSEIIQPQVEFFKRIEDEEIKIFTYAPERDTNFELTKYLSQKNIVSSAGHSNATSDEIKQAISHGLKQVTHLFNAMASLHHRNPGIIGESLVNDDLFVEIITDGLHLDPIIVDIVLRIKPESKVILISDSLPLNRYRKNTLVFGGQNIYKKNNKAVNSTGTIAGSMIFMNEAINNINNWKLANFSHSIKYASSNIAQNINLNNLGCIDKGKTADLVLWTKDYKVNTTIINGKVIFKSQ